MNYLAHLYLSEPQPYPLLGNLLGDFCKGRDLGYLPPGFDLGVRQHRAIDAFTDSHDSVRQARHLFAPEFRRYSGIILDMVFDHFLARHWQAFSAYPLADMSRDANDLLRIHEPLLIPAMWPMARFIRERDLLSEYRHLDILDRSLQGISRRLTRHNPLAEAGGEIRRQYDELETVFWDFFPSLIDYVDQQHHKPAFWRSVS